MNVCTDAKTQVQIVIERLNGGIISAPWSAECPSCGCEVPIEKKWKPLTETEATAVIGAH